MGSESMYRRIGLRSLVGLAVVGMLLSVTGGKFDRTVRADNGKIDLIFPEAGAGIEDTWVPPDTGFEPDGVTKIDPDRLPPEPVKPRFEPHPSGIIGLSAGQEIPNLSGEESTTRSYDLYRPGDGLGSAPADSSTDSGQSFTGGSGLEADLDLAVAYPGRGFLQNTAGETSSGYVSVIDFPALNGNPNGFFLTTLIYRPGGVVSSVHDHPIGAYYSSSFNQWTVLNEDATAMYAGPAFNIFMPSYFGTYFTHFAAEANITANFTKLNHSSINGNPNAFIFVMPVFNPAGTIAGPGYYNHRISVHYETSDSSWYIYNEDGEIVPSGAAFYVYIANPMVDVVYKHQSTAENTSFHYTVLDHPKLNGKPNAVLIVQHQRTERYLDETIGVWYDYESRRWRIYKNDGASFSVGEKYNVLILPGKSDTFVLKVTDSNRYPSPDIFMVRIDHPLLNNNPNMEIFVQHNWSPSGTSTGILDDHPTAVIYYDNHWNIFHTDYAEFTIGAAYNIYVTTPQLNAYSIEAWPFNMVAGSLSLNHPVANGRSSAAVIETPTLSPAAGNSSYPFGWTTTVNYSDGRWRIDSPDGGGLYEYMAFNIFLPDRNVFIHITTSSSYPDYVSFATCFDNPLTNNRPEALVFVTANDTPYGASGPIENSNLGVYYDGDFKKWCVYTEDLSVIANSTGFNVFVGDSKVFMPLIRR